MRSLAESGVQVATAAGGFDHATICDPLAGVPILRVALRCSEAVRRRRLDSEPHNRPIASLDRAVEDVHAEWTYELEPSTDEALPHELAQHVTRPRSPEPTQPCGNQPVGGVQRASSRRSQGINATPETAPRRRDIQSSVVMKRVCDIPSRNLPSSSTPVCRNARRSTGRSGVLICAVSIGEELSVDVQRGGRRSYSSSGYARDGSWGLFRPMRWPSESHTIARIGRSTVRTSTLPGRGSRDSGRVGRELGRRCLPTGLGARGSESRSSVTVCRTGPMARRR